MNVARGLDPISLDELVERADRQIRVDRKYLVPVHVLPNLIEALAPGTRILEIDGLRTFAYRSTYFDTPNFTAYLGAARRRRHRFKVRTRAYLDSGDCFIEVKTRGARATTVKNRVPHPIAASDRLDVSAQQFVISVLEQTIAFTPTLVTAFDRMTIHLPESDSRMTIDTALTWHSANRDALAHLSGLAVVETKTGSTPSSADRVLWRHGLRPVRISKYATGMAVLHPELPSTPWHRTIDRHIRPRLVIL